MLFLKPHQGQFSQLHVLPSHFIFLNQFIIASFFFYETRCTIMHTSVPFKSLICFWFIFLKILLEFPEVFSVSGCNTYSKINFRNRFLNTTRFFPFFVYKWVTRAEQVVCNCVCEFKPFSKVLLMVKRNFLGFFSAGWSLTAEGPLALKVYVFWRAQPRTLHQWWLYPLLISS